MSIPPTLSNTPCITAADHSEDTNKPPHVGGLFRLETRRSTFEGSFKG